MRELIWVGINVDPRETSEADIEAALEEERALLRAYTNVSGKRALSTTTIYPNGTRVTTYHVDDHAFEFMEVTTPTGQVGFGARVASHQEGKAAIPAMRTWFRANQAAHAISVTVWSLSIPS
ncbi:MAG: hypothetical protein IT406_00295 [Candidatus Yanofskybacteria bacterium]|nr:hypothetical protein [Candidatus Yanofskybacteria bacterium]